MSTTSTHAELGFNRTGVATSPELTEEMVEGTSEFPPPADGDERALALTRGEYARQAEPLGSVPPPNTGKGMLHTASAALRGESPTQLIDKLGERLAFERTGTRLYEAILTKLDALGSFDGGPSRAELEAIALEEWQHMQLLMKLVVGLGADPTVMTPSADLHATMTKGVIEVVVDPRTGLVECLEAALLAELADNDCWRALSELAERAGEGELAEACAQALREESVHLTKVRTWLANAQGRQRPS